MPSIVYGLWGAYVVLDYLHSVQTWIGAAFGWIPIFSEPRIPNSIAYSASAANRFPQEGRNAAGRRRVAQ